MENIFFSGSIIFMMIGVLAAILAPILGTIGYLTVVPMLMVVSGLPPEMAIPIGLTHLAALKVPSAVGQWQAGNVESKLLLLLMLGILPGIVLGNTASTYLHNFSWFNYLVLLPYIVLLAGAVIHRVRPFTVLPRPNNKYRKKVIKIVYGLPGKTFFGTTESSVPVIVPVIMGLGFGFVGKVFGPVAALMLSPLLIICLDIPVMVAVATALVTNFVGMLLIALASDFVVIPLNLQILLWLFLGSSMVILSLSTFLQRHKVYPAPVAALLVLVTSVTLWALTSNQPHLDLLIQHFSISTGLLGWFGGVQG